MKLNCNIIRPKIQESTLRSTLPLFIGKGMTRAKFGGNTYVEKFNNADYWKLYSRDFDDVEPDIAQHAWWGLGDFWSMLINM